jgi:hypothetical protein
MSQTVGERLAELWRDTRDMKDQIGMLQMCITENDREAKLLSAKPLGERLTNGLLREVLESRPSPSLDSTK